METVTPAGTTGAVLQVIGPVVDCEFPADAVPEIYDALEIARGDEPTLILEVQQHLGENRVRTISMDSTDGLTRGTPVVGTAVVGGRLGVARHRADRHHPRRGC